MLFFLFGLPISNYRCTECTFIHVSNYTCTEAIHVPTGDISQITRELRVCADSLSTLPPAIGTFCPPTLQTLPHDLGATPLPYSFLYSPPYPYTRAKGGQGGHAYQLGFPRHASTDTEGSAGGDRPGNLGNYKVYSSSSSTSYPS